jgi:hypothetical protein
VERIISKMRAECLICTYAGQAHALRHYIKRSVWRTVCPFTGAVKPRLVPRLDWMSGRICHPDDGMLQSRTAFSI